MELSDILKKHFAEVEAKVGPIDEKVGEAMARLFDLEQKAARAETYGGGSGFDGFGSADSWGAQFIEAEGLREFAEEKSRPGRFRMAMKAIIGSGPTSGGSLAQPFREAEPVVMPRRRLQVRDLLPVVPISSGSVEYPKQTTRTNAAAPVAEGQLKPQSDYAWTLETAPVRTIAHWTQATRQILDDAPRLAATIDTELRYGLGLAEEGEILNGDGTGEHLDGLIANATAYAAPFDPAGTETMIDQLALAMLQVALADFEPSGVVLHPSDWVRARLLKNGQGEYLLGDPATAASPVLFGLPVVATPAIAVDKFLVGAFPQAATLYDRMAPTVMASTEDADNFRRNLVTLLAEERVALGVKNGSAMVYGDLGGVALAARSGKAK